MDQEDETTTAHGGVLVELPLGDAAPDFNLEKAVCSHGLFMMAPNHWDPHSKTLKRPLRLNLDDDEISVVVQVSHPPHSAHALHLLVFGTLALSPEQQQSLLVGGVLLYFICIIFLILITDYYKMHISCIFLYSSYFDDGFSFSFFLLLSLLDYHFGCRLAVAALMSSLLVHILAPRLYICLQLEIV